MSCWICVLSVLSVKYCIVDVFVLQIVTKHIQQDDRGDSKTASKPHTDSLLAQVWMFGMCNLVQQLINKTAVERKHAFIPNKARGRAHPNI